jgi:hypothetical protein
MTNIEYPNNSSMLQIVALTNFKVFNAHDWMAFAGCESDVPMIGYYQDYTIVIDGPTVNIIHTNDEYGGELYHLE